MSNRSGRIFVSSVVCLLLATGLVAGAIAQDGAPSVSLYVVVEGCGDPTGGGCTTIANGTGNATNNNSSLGGYGDNEAAPLTLFNYTFTGIPTGTVSVARTITLPQAPSGANLAISGEYGSSSEGILQLDGTGRYLTLMGYGIDAPTFDAAYHPPMSGQSAVATDYTPCSSGGVDPYGAAPSGALAQTGSLAGQCYTPIPRVIALIDANGNVNTSTANYNVFNTNNPRSTYSLDGYNFYISGQGSGTDETGGVFYNSLGSNSTSFTPVSITGVDGGTGVSQDTRAVQIYNSGSGNQLYVSTDSKKGATNRDFIGTLGSAGSPPTSLANSGNGPTQLTGFGSTATGDVTITAGNGNGLAASGKVINLSPISYFFASPSVLYVADGGNPKNSSGETSKDGLGGLQKWINNQANGSGAWSLAYTLHQGLNLVANSSSAGTTGLLGLTGTVVNGVAYLYTTNSTINDLDQDYIYAISDTLSTTSYPGTSFAEVAAAPLDSNFKGISLAPAYPPGSATITSSPSGLAFTSTGSDCAPGTYTTPVTLIWTSTNPCELSVVSPQTASGTQYVFSQWQDGTTATTDSVAVPTTSAVYTASFQAAPLNVTSLVSVTGSGAVVNRITHIATETFTVTNTSSSTIAGPIQLLLSMGSSGITPVGQSGTYLGNPYWTASSALAPGAFVTFTVELNYATAVGFISAPTIYSGGL